MTALTGPSNWPLEPPLVFIAVAGLLYALGLRRRSSRRRDAPGRRRAAAFYSGLLTLAAAFDSPIASYDDRFFAVHMTQHVLLWMVAPPLIVLGRPWPLVWRPLPLRLRRTAAKGLARGAWASPLRVIARTLARPLPAFVLASGVMVVWHLPPLYDATVRHASIHEVEHALFLATSLLFWSHLIDSPPVRSRLDHLRRTAYAVAALAVAWVLAVVLALAHSPFYGVYADRLGHAGGLSALSDQQLGAGVLWVPGSIPLVLAICVNFYTWLDPDAGRRAARLAGQH